MEWNNKEDANGIDTRKNDDNVVFKVDESCVHDGEEMRVEMEKQPRHSRLMQGCTSLMYACQHGYMDIIIEEMRTKVSYEFTSYFV